MKWKRGKALVVVFDFDGTITDAEVEGAPYTEGCVADLAQMLDQPLEDVQALARQFQQRIAADPMSYGWAPYGRIIAPAIVDPYLRIIPVTGMILDHYGYDADLVARKKVQDALYAGNYPKTAIKFRPGAFEVLEAVRAAVRGMYIVTNSGTEMVQRKIRILCESVGRPKDADDFCSRVIGGARKYQLDDSFTQIRESIPLPGLTRPVYLRRRAYFDILQELLVKHGARWQEMLVVGDIFEMDLAVPFMMNSRLGLMANQFTPQYELDLFKPGKNFFGQNRLLNSLLDVERVVDGDC